MTAHINKTLFFGLFFSFLFFGASLTKAGCNSVATGCNYYWACPVAEEACHMENQYYSCNCGDRWTACGSHTAQNCANTCFGESWTCRDWTERRFGWECTGGWDYNSYTYGCDCWDVQVTDYCYAGQGCDQCSAGEACVGGGCPVSQVQYCQPIYENVCTPDPTPSCVADITCIAPDGSTRPEKVCFGLACPGSNDFPTKPAPGCNQIGEPYPIAEPGKCARNCTSADGVTNLWDYVDCAPGTNPPPAQNCPGYCGYAGGTVPNGQGGQKICPTTPACPPGLFGSGNGIGGNGLVNPLPTPVPIATSSFFQVQDAGVMAQQGGIVNRMPVGTTLSKGVAGVIIANGASNFGSGHASNTNWVAGSDLDNTGVISGKLNYRYDYDYVSRRIISTIKPNPGPNFVVLPSQLMVEPAQDYGIYWTKVTGDLDIVGDLNFGSNKVVVLVEGNANIKGKINFTKNEGLFALYAKGNINIDPSVGAPGAGSDPTGLPAHIEGLYLAQGSFNTGASASQLRLEGAYVGIGGVNLQRNLNSAWPSEYFVFRPDILINLPKQLLRQNHQWQELAP